MMHPVWKSPRVVDQLVVAGNAVAMPDGEGLVGIDRDGKELWTRAYDPAPMELTAFGRTIAFKQSFRRAPSIVIGIDLEGTQRWKFERDWFIGSDGLAADEHGLVVSGGDYTGDGQRWVMLSESGELVCEVASPTDEPACLAGEWIFTSGSDRREIVRADRRGANPTVISTFAHITTAASSTHVVAASETEAAIVELASGRECFRTDVGSTLRIGVYGERAAWVDADRHPVVYDLTTGHRIWRGAPMGQLPPRRYYDCYLGPTGLVCYGEDEVAFYDLVNPEPIATTRSTQRGAFWNDRFLELTDEGVVCWQLP